MTVIVVWGEWNSGIGKLVKNACGDGLAGQRKGNDHGRFSNIVGFAVHAIDAGDDVDFDE